MQPGRRAPLTPQQGTDALDTIISAIKILAPKVGLRIPITIPQDPKYESEEGRARVSLVANKDWYDVLAWYDPETETVTYGWENVNNTAHHLHEHFHTTAWTAVADVLLFIVKLRLGEEIAKHQGGV